MKSLYRRTTKGMTTTPCCAVRSALYDQSGAVWDPANGPAGQCCCEALAMLCYAMLLPARSLAAFFSLIVCSLCVQDGLFVSTGHYFIISSTQVIVIETIVWGDMSVLDGQSDEESAS